MPVLRIPAPLESLKGVADYSVFISYRANQLDLAERLEDGLAALGFPILMVKRDQYREHDDLVLFLRNLANEADAICVFLSKEAMASRWVETEIAEAARVLGRIVFVSDPSLPVPESYTTFEDPNEEISGVGLVVKHTTVKVTEWSAEAFRALGSEIVNDPEEGWFEPEDRDLESWLTREIKAEAEMMKYARRCLMVDPRCSGETIRDVIPFREGSIDEAGSPEELFMRYAKSRGRPSLIESLRTGELDGMATTYFASDLEVLGPGEEWLEVLYTRVPGR